jgi:ribonucleoside-diphosphate reductase alpha chain
MVDRSFKLDWQTVRTAIKQHGMRNSNCMAIAPTATIANIAGVFPSIEPIYKNVYVKSNMSGEFIVISSYLVEDLKKKNLWSRALLEEIKGHDGNINEVATIPQEIKDKYKEVFDIEPAWLVKAAAHRGKWIDQSQSLNLFAKGNSGKKISDMYQYAWAMGLKTTYYLRTLAATTVEQSGLDLAKQKNMSTVVRQTEQEVVVPEPVPAPETQPLGQPLAATVTAASGSAATAAVDPLQTVSLCKIDDPDCESCQ